MLKMIAVPSDDNALEQMCEALQRIENGVGGIAELLIHATDDSRAVDPLAFTEHELRLVEEGRRWTYAVHRQSDGCVHVPQQVVIDLVRVLDRVRREL